MPVELPPPDVLAMILARRVLCDLAADEWYIEGAFKSLAVAEFPAPALPLTVFATLTGGHGPTQLELRLVDVDGVQTLGACQTGVNFTDPLGVADALFRLAHVRFPAPGEYRVQLFAGGQLLKERRLVVKRGLA